MESVKDDLIAARAVIADESRWTKAAFAEDKNGRPVNSQAPDAARWCADGALRKVAESDHSTRFMNVRDALARESFSGGIIGTNDKGHGAVLRMYDRAIEAEC